MRLDLVRYHMTRLAFSSSHALENNILAAIAGLEAPTVERAEGAMRFVETYRRSHMFHGAVALAWVPALSQEDRRFHCAFTFGVVGEIPEGRAGQPVFPGQGPTVSKFLEVLSQASATYEFECTAQFEYPLADFKPILSLPLRVSSWVELPFDEIDGVRFVKRQGENELYSVIVQVADEALVVSVSYEHQEAYSMELPKNILAKAVGLSRRFVRSSVNRRA